MLFFVQIFFNKLYNMSSKKYLHLSERSRIDKELFSEEWRWYENTNIINNSIKNKLLHGYDLRYNISQSLYNIEIEYVPLCADSFLDNITDNITENTMNLSKSSRVDKELFSGERRSYENILIYNISENLYKKKLLDILKNNYVSTNKKLYYIDESNKLFNDNKCYNMYAGGLMKDWDY